MSRPFAVIGITVFLVCAVLFDAPSKLLLFAFLGLVALLCVSVAIKSIRTRTAVPTALASAALACLMLIVANEISYYPALKLTGAEHNVKLLITGECEAKYGNFYYEAKTTEIDSEKAGVKLRLVFSSSPDFAPYDEVEGTFKFYRLGTTSEDLLSSYKAENRYTGAYPSGDGFVITKKAGESFHIGKVITDCRRAIKSAVMKVLPNDYGALCTAMILGDRSLLSDGAYTSLRNCSITHIICVSGLHIALWSGAILSLLKRLRLKEKAACAVAVPAVIVMMMITGMTYSVVRSGIMMIIYLLSVILSQRKDSLNSLGIALTAICIVNPFSAGALGFRLSALSTLGIILCSEKVMPRIAAFYVKNPKIAFTQSTVKLFAVTFSAVIFTLPITLVTFGTFSFGVFISNLLIIWLAQPCMICAFLGAVTALISTSIINVPAFIAGIFAKCILHISGFIGANSHIIPVQTRDAYIIIGILYLFCLVCAIISIFKGGKMLKGALIGFVALFTVIMAVYGVIQFNATHITVFNTGSGACTLITKKNDRVLIDCGGDSFSASYRIKTELTQTGENSATLLLTGLTDGKTDYLKNISAAVTFTEVLCENPGYGIKMMMPKSNFIEGFTNYESGEIKLTALTKDDTCFYLAETSDITAVFVPGNYDGDDIPAADILISDESFAGNVNGDFKIVTIRGDGLCINGENEEEKDLIIRALNNHLSYERG